MRAEHGQGCDIKLDRAMRETSPRRRPGSSIATKSCAGGALSTSSASSATLPAIVSGRSRLASLKASASRSGTTNAIRSAAPINARCGNERERLYAEFRAERSHGDERRATWEEQRASERALRRDHRAQGRVPAGTARDGAAPQIAMPLAAFRAAQERVDLRDAIAYERAALKRDLHLEQRQAWREFVIDRAYAGDDAAISALRGLRYREQRVEREHEMETPDFALRGAGDVEPRFIRDLRDVDARVERNGDVSYRWRNGGEAFRDRGPEIAFRDTSDASVAAGLELARAKWGNEVTIHGSADFKERALRLAVERGMRVNNPELQDRQRELVVERERTRSQRSRTTA